MKRFIYFILGFSTMTLGQADDQNILYHLIDNLPPVIIDPLSETIGHTWTRTGGVYEQHVIQKFYALLPHDKPIVVFDLGAQTGAFSLMAKFLPLSRWYAFEPLQEAAEVLVKNLALNDIANVVVYQRAATDHTGTAILMMPDQAQWGLSTLGAHPLRFTTISTQREIMCVDLDTFIERNDIGRVDFIKIDTEGSELAILRGAQKMIMRDRPLILMEYNETNMRQCGVLKSDVSNFLTALGYIWEHVSSDDILCMPIQ